MLIPAEFLVNHRSIQWDDRAQEVTVYHLELDTHDILFANGTPAGLKAELGATVLELTLASHDDAVAVAATLGDLTTKSVHVDGSVVELTVDNGPLVGAEALRRVDASSSELLGLSLREPSLDDVFLELTGQRTDVDIEGLAAGQSEGKKKSRRRVKESS